MTIRELYHGTNGDNILGIIRERLTAKTDRVARSRALGILRIGSGLAALDSLFSRKVRLFGHFEGWYSS